MKTPLVLLLFVVSLACHKDPGYFSTLTGPHRYVGVFTPLGLGHALRCHTCAASNEEDCNQQGSTSCPQYADACATITGPNTVLKSCTYKGFCEKAQGSSSGARMVCCFGDNCNGPHRSHSHGGLHHNGAGALASSPVVLMATVLLRMAFTHL